MKKAPQLRLSQIFKYPVAILTIWTDPFALAGYWQIELIDESLFSATKEDQEKFSFSIVLPEAELKNFKEGDVIEVGIFDASLPNPPSRGRSVSSVRRYIP